MVPEDEISNYELFRDILAGPLIEKCNAAISGPKARQKRKNRRKSSVEEANNELPLQRDESDAEELAEFIDYLAFEIFTSLPPSLRTLNHRAYINTPSLRSSYPNPLTPNACISILAGLSPAATDSLSTYLLPSSVTLTLTPSSPPYLTHSPSLLCHQNRRSSLRVAARCACGTTCRCPTIT